MKKNFQRKGFTLIELLVVIVILGILSTISVGTFRSYFAKARDSERVSTVQNIAMMIKVDSGGSGDCTVYNYDDSLIGSCTGNKFGLLLSSNDYSMAGPKNGLEYFYGFREGTIEGDNDFFVMVLAEESGAQNGKTMEAAENVHAFVDGTSKGIAVVEQKCTLSATTDGVQIPVCPADTGAGANTNGWTIKKITNGALSEATATVVCADYSDETTCEAVAGCSWGTDCTGTPS